MNAPIDVTGVVLKTERLILRPWTMEDAGDMFAYAASPDVGPRAGWPPHESIETSRKIIGMFIEGKKTFALEYQGRVIGSLGIEKYNEALFPELKDRRCREIGYVLAKGCWGLGLMPEAVREALRYCFADVGLDAALCGHSPDNAQSARVQEKCGFHRYGKGTFQTQMGEERETLYNILWRSEWEAARHG